MTGFTAIAAVFAVLLFAFYGIRAEVLVSDIVDSCYSYLESHLCEGRKWGKPYHFYKPSIDKYSSDQWLWDSGSHMIVWAQKNVSNSILDMRTMLQMQQDDGRIPEQIYWMERTPVEEAEILLQYSSVKVTDTTQMPVLPYSLRAMYNQTKDKALLKEFLPPLVNYFDWWRSARDLGDGLVVVIHNWESGLDASPAYDPAFHVYVTELNQTSFRQVYPKFIELIESYKLLYKWDQKAILGRQSAPDKPSRIDNWFVVKDLAVNCVYASGWNVLATLADELGDTTTAQHCREQSKITTDAILTKMWIPEQGHFNTLYVDSDGVEKTSIANTVQNLFPLLLPELPSDKKNVILSQLKDETKFATPFAIPTVARDDPQFSATFDVDLMWRGPVWGFTNWFILEGLGLHGEFDLQAMILQKWISLVQLSGIWEHYNPLTGEPYGPEGLGMSTLVCDYIQRFGMV